jgi:hypothetical protein
MTSTTNIPDPQATLASLAPVTTLAYNALEVGTMKAQAYFAAEALKIDPWAASTLTRLHAKQYLENESSGLGLDLRLEALPNIGIRFAFNGFAVWILKVSDGGLPLPGLSTVKQGFYNQIPLLFPDLDAGAGNIIILWDATADYNLIGLSLVCPRSGDLTRASLDVYWHIEIPPPATLVAPETPERDRVDAGDVDPLDEIRLISRDRASAEGKK